MIIIYFLLKGDREKYFSLLKSRHQKQILALTGYFYRIIEMQEN